MSDMKPDWRQRAWLAESHELTPPSEGRTAEEWRAEIDAMVKSPEGRKLITYAECEHDWFEMESNDAVTVEGLRQCRKCGGVSMLPGATDAFYEVRVDTPMTATEVLAGQLVNVVPNFGSYPTPRLLKRPSSDHMAAVRAVARGG